MLKNNKSIAVVNASPLIYLAKIGVLNILKQLYTEAQNEAMMEFI